MRYRSRLFNQQAYNHRVSIEAAAANSMVPKGTISRFILTNTGDTHHLNLIRDGIVPTPLSASPSA